MKKISFWAIALCSVAIFSSCKSSESAYKKAYEKAQAQAAQYQQPTTVTTAPAEVKVTPVAPVAPAPQTIDVSNEPTRTENVQLISGTGLKDYSVICGSFKSKANAEGLQRTLNGKGYSAQIVYNPSNQFYRVAASTYADKVSAVQSRNALRSAFPDAWLLLRGK